MLKGTESKVQFSSHMYQGFADMEPVLVNPTLEELNKHGKMTNREPDYVDKESGTHRMRVYHKWSFEGKDFLEPITFRLTNDEIYSEKKGTYLFINNKAEFKWGISLEQLAEDNAKYGPDEEFRKFNIDEKYNPRKCKKGEVALTNYLIALSGYDKKKPDFSIDVSPYWENLMKGDVKAVKEVLGDLSSKGRKVRILVMIDKSRQAMELFSDESAIGQSPFLKQKALAYPTSEFSKFLFNLQKDERTNQYTIVGPYSKSHKYDIGFEAKLIERTMPDISMFTKPQQVETTKSDYGIASSPAVSADDVLPF